jgi:membrane associated rhomboid family serine protease
VNSPRHTIAAAALVAAIHLLPGAAEALSYVRSGSAVSIDWTLLTAHLTHWDLRHLIWDSLALLVLGWMIESRSVRLWWGVIGFGIASVSSVVLLAQPSLTAYRGLSGIDSALFTAAVIVIGKEAHRHRDPLGMIVASGSALAFLAKVTWEWSTGIALFAQPQDSSYVVVPIAHIAGAVAGAVAVWIDGLLPLKGYWESDVTNLSNKKEPRQRPEVHR